MSITFTSDAQATETKTVEEPCLCAQMADCFCDAFEAGIQEAHREELRREADPGCRRCGGSGVEEYQEDNRPMLNMANVGALTVLRALKLVTGRELSDYAGTIGICEARRALLRARNRQDLSSYTVAGETVYGAPRALEDGTVQLRPVRLLSFGVDEDNLRERLDRFAAFVEAAGAAGATTIYWG